jgi:hypothetical protein
MAKIPVIAGEGTTRSLGAITILVTSSLAMTGLEEKPGLATIGSPVAWEMTA